MELVGCAVVLRDGGGHGRSKRRPNLMGYVCPATRLRSACLRGDDFPFDVCKEGPDPRTAEQKSSPL